MTKKETIKTAIMDHLNKKVSSVSRKEIAEVTKDLGSNKTTQRALSELKSEGKLTVSTDKKTSQNFYCSTEPAKKETTKKNKPAKKTEKKPGKKNESKKDSAGKSNKKGSAKKTKPAKKDKTKKTKPTKGKSTKKTSKRNMGVIASIIKCISKKPRSKKQILKILVKKFPERSEESMKKTVSLQVPTFLRKTKSLNVQRIDKKYFIEPGPMKKYKPVKTK